MAEKTQVTVENINCPGQTSHIDAEKYAAMKRVLLKVLPKKPPGLTQAEMKQAILPHLPDELWPGGAKSMWWAKTVQLDLEAKKILARTDNKPLSWYQTNAKAGK